MDFLMFLACLAAFSAGFIDAIVGGGGLIQAPAMFLIYPQMPVLAVIGTNRTASLMGTLMAGYQYARKIPIPWRIVFSAGVGAVVCAYLGAQLASHLPPKTLKSILLVLMTVLALYTFFNKGLGQGERKPIENKRLFGKSLLLGAIIGFYNGFVGPGTGTLLVFGFVIWLKFNFLEGSGISKFVNVIADVSSLIFFLLNGLVVFYLALPMIFCNVAGSYLGSRLAVLKGSAFIRIIFMCIVSVLVGKFGYDLWIE